jgi:hypothetical protein
MVIFMSAALAVAADGNASIFVVHGIPGKDLGLDPALAVDVSVNDGCALQDFKFGDIAGPLSLPAGTYSVAIRTANAAAPCGNPPVLGPVDLSFDGGTSYSVVAHLAEAGAPTASVFTNDLSLTPGLFGARVILHHTAAAPAVDATLDRNTPWGVVPKFKLEDFRNGEQAVVPAWAGAWLATLYPTGTDIVAAGPVDLRLQKKAAYLIFAVGSLQQGTFTFLVETVYDLK